MKVVLMSLVAIFFIAVCADGQTATLAPVTIKGSEVRSLSSKQTGRSYDLYIQFSGKREPGKKYPVLYVLDGQWDFKLMDSVAGGLYYDKFIPSMIIVGITYSGEAPDYDRLRGLDLTPVADPNRPGTGDGPKFLDFLEKDVIPLIEKNYPADPARRILQGSSLGGMFTLYTLFKGPSLFWGYVAASPAVSYGDNVLFKQEQDYAATRKELSARVFISVGAIEQLSQPVQSFIEKIRLRGYQGLKLETRVIEGERHAGNKPEAFNRGLRFVFQD